MKKSWPNLVLLIGVMVLIGFISQRHSGRRISWEPNYRMNSRVPFGCYLTDRYLSELMTSENTHVDQTANMVLRDTVLANRNYFFINDEFTPSALDVIELCRFVSEGNTVFIAAESFGFLEDTLDLKVGDPMEDYMQQDATSTLNGMINYNSDSVRLNLVNPRLKLKQSAVYDRAWYSNTFLKFPVKQVAILGVESSGYPNYIRYKMGDGYFLLHTMPDAFCNYYAGKRLHATYIFGALSYLPDQETIIDDHYKLGKSEEGDSRKFILSQPALRLAYFLLISAGIVALLFGGKRRQRSVPLVPALRNGTLDFVEQIGALYYRQSDHSNIIQKKINYFLESVRSRFYVSTLDLDERLVDKVAALSGVPVDQVKKLFYVISTMQRAQEHSSHDLKQLVELIREFNKRSKR